LTQGLLQYGGAGRTPDSYAEREVQTVTGEFVVGDSAKVCATRNVRAVSRAFALMDC